MENIETISIKPKIVVEKKSMKTGKSYWSIDTADKPYCTFDGILAEKIRQGIGLEFGVNCKKGSNVIVGLNNGEPYKNPYFPDKKGYQPVATLIKEKTQYVEFTKDLFVALIEAKTAGTPSELMELCIDLIKMAKEAFEDEKATL